MEREINISKLIANINVLKLTLSVVKRITPSERDLLNTIIKNIEYELNGMADVEGELPIL